MPHKAEARQWIEFADRDLAPLSRLYANNRRRYDKSFAFFGRYKNLYARKNTGIIQNF